MQQKYRMFANLQAVEAVRQSLCSGAYAVEQSGVSQSKAVSEVRSGYADCLQLSASPILTCTAPSLLLGTEAPFVTSDGMTFSRLHML